jgi:hypothetical protein
MRRKPAMLSSAPGNQTRFATVQMINHQSTKGTFMKTEITQPKPVKKLALTKTTIRVLTPVQDKPLPVPTEGCTGSCGG